MAISGAARQRAYMQRQREAATHQAAELMVLGQQIKTLRIEVEALREENAALKAELSRARQAAPKPPRRPRDLAQHLYPTVRRPQRP